MLYQRPSFTCPAANAKTSQVDWDLAFLTKKEFINKYPKLAAWYNETIG